MLLNLNPVRNYRNLINQNRKHKNDSGKLNILNIKNNMLEIAVSIFIFSFTITFLILSVFAVIFQIQRIKYYKQLNKLLSNQVKEYQPPFKNYSYTNPIVN